MTAHNPHVGSDFDSFLDSEGILDEVSAVAVKRVLAWQLEQNGSVNSNLPPVGKQNMQPVTHGQPNQK